MPSSRSEVFSGAPNGRRAAALTVIRIAAVNIRIARTGPAVTAKMGTRCPLTPKAMRPAVIHSGITRAMGILTAAMTAQRMRAGEDRGCMLQL